MPLSERIQQVNREISATVERAISDLRQEVSQHLRSGHEEILRRLNEISPSLPGAFIPEHLGAEADALEQAAREAAQQAAGVSEETAARRAGEARSAAFTAVRDALAGIDRARSQAEILSALLRESARFAARSAVFLVRGAELRGWGGQGFGDAEEAIRQLTLAPPAGGGWSRLAEGQAAVRLSAGEAGVLCSRIETALPHEGVLIPLVLRDRVAAGLYADRAEGELACEALQALCHAAAMAIELLPFRERPFTPTLALDDGTVAPPEEPPAPAVPVPEPVAPEPVAAAAPEPEPEAPALEAAAATFATTAQAIPPEEAWSAPVAPEPAAVTEPEVEAEVDAEPEVEVEAEVDGFVGHIHVAVDDHSRYAYLEQHPDERVAWHSVGGTDHAGVVTFHRLADDLTRVTLQLDTAPEGLRRMLVKAQDRLQSDPHLTVLPGLCIAVTALVLLSGFVALVPLLVARPSSRHAALAWRVRELIFAWSSRSLPTSKALVGLACVARAWVTATARFS